MSAVMEGKIRTLKMMGIPIIAHNDWGILVKNKNSQYELINIHLGKSFKVEHSHNSMPSVDINEHFISIDRLISWKGRKLTRKQMLFVRDKDGDLLSRNGPNWNLHAVSTPGIEVVVNINVHIAQMKATLINYRGKRMVINDPKLHAFGRSYIVKGKDGLYYFVNTYIPYGEYELENADRHTKDVISVFDADLNYIKPVSKQIQTT